MNTLWAICVLTGMAASGVAALWRWRRLLGLAPLEVVAFGIPLGTVVSSLLCLAIAVAFGFNALAVWLVVALSLLVAAGLCGPELGAGARWAAGGASPDGIGPLGRLAQVGRLRGVSRDGEAGQIGIVSIPPVGSAPDDAGGWPAVAWARGVARGAVPPRVGWVPVLFIGAFGVRWAFLWSGALTYDGAGNLFAGHINIWGDWAQHIGDVNAFVSGDNFPPQHPRYAGVSYAYHYLASFTAAAMVQVGMGTTQALSLHSFLFSIVIALCVYAFGRRLTRDAWSAGLGMTIFFLGGGLAWLLTVADIDRDHSPWDVLRDGPWDGGAVAAANYGWYNVYFASIEPQRAFLYGLPLCLLVFTLLHTAVQPTGLPASSLPRLRAVVSSVLPVSPTPRLPVFAAAGAVAGLLPFAHLGPLPLLAMVTLCLFGLFPSRGWVVFGLVWIGLTVPQLLLQGDGGGETFSSVRTQLGWIAAPDPWWWFWLKNLGWFAPILILGFLDRSLFPPVARRFLWAFMPVFAIANLYVFQPDAWDNAKLLTYWFLAGSIVVGAALVKAWRANPAPAIRLAVAAVTLSLVLSGLLVNLSQAEGHDRYLLLTREELDVAARVRAETPPHALFAVGLQSNHPVPMMGGRRVVMSYPGWLWPRGIDYGQRERDLRTIYALGPESPGLIAQYGIDYLVVGPWERENFAADSAAWRARYPLVIETPSYQIFRVR